MSIQDIFSNFKRFYLGRDLGLALLLVAVGLGSFFLGRASISPQNGSYEVKEPFSATAIEPASALEATDAGEGVANAQSGQDSAVSDVAEGGYVASKNGTKYHLPWCSGAKRIKEENKVWFKTKEEAEAAGYTPAANCKGI